MVFQGFIYHYEYEATSQNPRNKLELRIEQGRLSRFGNVISFLKLQARLRIDLQKRVTQYAGHAWRSSR